jgi:hypothetical protein
MALEGGEWSSSCPSHFTFPWGKSPCYPLYRRLGGSQSRYGHGGEEKNFQAPPGIKPCKLKINFWNFWRVAVGKLK